MDGTLATALSTYVTDFKDGILGVLTTNLPTIGVLVISLAGVILIFRWVRGMSGV